MSATKRSIITTIVVLASLTLTSCAQQPLAQNGEAPIASPVTKRPPSSALQPAADGSAGQPGAYVTVTTTPHAKFGEAPAAVAAESAAKGKSLMKTIRTNLDSKVILSASISSPPAFANPSTNWFYATVAAPDVENGGAVYPLWLGNVAQGSIAEQLAQSGNLKDSIGGSSFSIQLPNGKILKDLTGGAGDIKPGQNFVAPKSDSTIKASALATLSKFGFKAKSIEVFHPLQVALAVTAVVPNASKANDQLGKLTAALLGSPYQYEALYVCLELPNGTKLAQSGTDYRTGGGTVWTNPSFAVTSGIGHG